MAQFHYFTDFASLKTQLNAQIAAVFIETPTNPLMNEIAIREAAELAHSFGALVLVDNTFLTPLRQKPLDEGADIVVHSGTKYLSGHNDLLAGVVVAKDAQVGERLAWLANTTGPTLAAFDSWVFIRSLKTFELRFNQQEKNALKVVAALKNATGVKEVLYPEKGAMISIRVTDASKISDFAESLGGVESLITYPTTQTHADIPESLRESYGLTPDLLRLSIGLEDADDLILDLETACCVFN